MERKIYKKLSRRDVILISRLHMLKSVTDTINTSFILESDGDILVFDGGFPSEAEYLHDYIISLGGVVNGWFLTHFHDDHVGAFLTIMNTYSDITVKNVYCDFPGEKFLSENEPMQSTTSSVDMLRLFKKTVAEQNISEHTVISGEVLHFGKVSVSVLLTHDKSIERDTINNTSCVFSVSVNQKKILFLGDLGPEGGARLLKSTPPHNLKSDYVQMSHHGQNGVENDVYAAILPDYCLWCTPSWLWDNMGSDGYDTGKFKTIVVRGYISSLGCVKRHYRMTEGTHVIEL